VPAEAQEEVLLQPRFRRVLREPVERGSSSSMPNGKSHAQSSRTVALPDTHRVLESIKANRRLPESRFSPLKLTQKSQNSIFGTLRDQG